jgi:hypothetical protein
MNLLKQGKTNWKYILIVVILAVIVGGGTLWYVKKQEVSPPEFIEIEKPEEVVSSSEECVAKGYSVTDTHPRQCKTPEGKIFIEKVEEKVEDEKLTLEELKNAEYYIITYDRTVQLKDGKYFKPWLPGSTTGLEVGISENKITFGDLNGDRKEDAAVIVRSTGGGSGVFYELAIMINKDGKPIYLTSKFLGDRIIINSLVIESGIITLDMTVHGPGDALCCPTLKESVKYKLSENKIIEI